MCALVSQLWQLFPEGYPHGTPPRSVSVFNCEHISALASVTSSKCLPSSPQVLYSECRCLTELCAFD